MLTVGQKIRIKSREYFAKNAQEFYLAGSFAGYQETDSPYFLPIEYLNDEVYEIVVTGKVGELTHYRIDDVTGVKENWVEKV